MPKASDPSSTNGDKHAPGRWTGKGPRPARHIPWPELFKHHQSVLTGHLKMMDMVRKHCVEGTGNHDTAKACVDRTHQMIKMFKQATYNFVPPQDSIDKVPIGASSASMYPGYSPADHIYGEAAQEFGERAAELKRKGMELELEPTGPQYVVGHGKKPRRLSNESDQAQSTSASPPAAQIVSRQDGEGEPMEGVEQSTSESQYFVIDSNPTPLAELGDMQKHKNKANDKAKRQVSFKEEQGVEANSLNRPRASKPTEGNGAKTRSAVVGFSAAAEEADISEEVETRLKAKEEKRKRREEKKRKRESGESLSNDKPSTSAIPSDEPVETALDEKPKKKKHKKDENELRDAAEPLAEVVEDNEAKMEKKKKKKRKNRADANEQPTVGAAVVEDEKPKKKMKKDATSE